MEIAVLSPLLVPNSTRPVWHQWQQQQQKSSNSARRRLFQEETVADEEQNKHFVQRLLAELAEHYKQKWNFDFDTEQPVDNLDSQFRYEPMPAHRVPGFYRLAKLGGCNGIGKREKEEEGDENQWSNGKWREGTAAGKSKEVEEERGEMGTEMMMMRMAAGQRTTTAMRMVEEMEMADHGEGGMTTMAAKSPTRAALRKPRRSLNLTPKRSGGGHHRQQPKLTEFLSARKSIPHNDANKADNLLLPSISTATVDSPTKRLHRRCSDCVAPMVSPSPIKKKGGANSQRRATTHQLVASMFK